MGVFDAFTADWQEGDFSMTEPMSIDLTTPAGFQALQMRAAEDVYTLIVADDGAWNLLAGRTLDDVAAQLAGDLLQESVSLPRSAFADPQAAGRELAVLRNVATYIYRQQLQAFITNRLATGTALPSGRTSPAHTIPHRQHLQK